MSTFRVDFKHQSHVLLTCFGFTKLGRKYLEHSWILWVQWLQWKNTKVCDWGLEIQTTQTTNYWCGSRHVRKQWTQAILYRLPTLQVLLHSLFGVAMGPTKPQIWKFHWRAGRGSRRCFGIHEFHAKSSSSWGAKKIQNLNLGLEDVWSVVSCIFSCFCFNQLFFSGVMMLNYWLS